MFERNYFGMMMWETGEADAMITGVFSKYAGNNLYRKRDYRYSRRIEPHRCDATSSIQRRVCSFLQTRYFNRHPSTEALIDIPVSQIATREILQAMSLLLQCSPTAILVLTKKRKSSKCTSSCGNIASMLS